MLSVQVGGKTFPVPKELLLKSSYFEGLLITNPEQIVVNRSRYGFRHILEYLYDDTYTIPFEHLRELDFYALPYPHYSAERDDNVSVILQGVTFKLRAKHLILNSKYFAQELPRLYIGKEIQLERNPKAFQHMLARMSNCHHVIPDKYRGERQFYGIQEIVWLDTTLVPLRNMSQKYLFPYKVLCESPYLKKFLDRYEAVPNIACPTKGFERLLSYLQRSVAARVALQCDDFIYERFELKPDRYYREILVPCSFEHCQTLLKQQISDDGWYVKANCYYCPNHTCKQCKEPRESSDFCVEHKCKALFCKNLAVEKGRCIGHK